MGIYDREYYRKEGPSYLEALIPSGQMCKWLIGINILMFVGQLITKPTIEEIYRNHQQMNGFKDPGCRQSPELLPKMPFSMWGPLSDSV